MQSIRFLKEGMQQYMVIDCEKKLLYDYASQLMQQQRVPYFIPYEIRELNGECQRYYRLQYHTTLALVADQLKGSAMHMKQMLASIIGVLETTEEYLLDVNRIVWKAEQIFVEADTGKLEFCYDPEEEGASSLRDLLAGLIPSTKGEEGSATLLLLEFYHLVTEPDCSMERLLAFRKEKLTECASILLQDGWKRDLELEEGALSDRKEWEQNKEQPSPERRASKLMWQGITVCDIALFAGWIVGILPEEMLSYVIGGVVVWIVVTILYVVVAKEESPEEMMQAYFKETDVIGRDGKEEMRNSSDIQGNHVKEDTGKTSYGETTVLEADRTKSAIVIEEKSKELSLMPSDGKEEECIRIKEKSIVVGCMQERVDYTISKKGISRMHAKLINQPDGLYLLDLNSTNGTRINGELLEQGKEYKLEEGDLVAFAAVEYYVVALAL